MPILSLVQLHPPHTLTSSRHLPSWALFAFAAGATNAGALLACERFVLHVTGTATRIGVDGNQWLALDYAMVLGAFVAGALLATVAVRVLATPSTRPYWIPLTAVAALLALAAVLGHSGAFGVFGGPVEGRGDFALLALLAFAMGMQNAAVAASTAMAVRTTHMTGPATDLAIGLATLIHGAPDERRGARSSIVLRGTKLASFILGGAAAAVLGALEWLLFLVPAAAVAAATLVSFAPRRLAAAHPNPLETER